MVYVDRAMTNDVLNFLGRPGAQGVRAGRRRSRRGRYRQPLARCRGPLRQDREHGALRIAQDRTAGAGRAPSGGRCERGPGTRNGGRAGRARRSPWARAAPEDPHAGLADPSLLAPDRPELDLFDPEAPASEDLVRQAEEAEAAALDVPGVTNSEGAGASRSETRVALVSSNGFAGSYRRSGCGLSVSVLAGEGTAMESEYDWSQAVAMLLTSRSRRRLAAAPARARSAGSARSSRRRPSCRWSSSSASRDGWSGRSPGPSTAPPSRAARAFSRMRWTNRC